MWLLNVETGQLESFANLDDRPAYAILSHTWADDEVSFQQLRNNEPGSRRSKGWSKIVGTCLQAKKDGLDYAWVDTCCIDKTSSAELSEAINSMYAWYRSAAVCYAFISDFDGSDTSEGSSFWACRWFGRGWTLQEMIAPADVVFYNANWREIGTKSGLLDAISQHTRIAADALLDSRLDDFSIAERMSWAANRRTTRVEDEAYCLLGLFDVHMPLIYGEGRNAFLRLQLELARRTDDHSIFTFEEQWQPTKPPRPLQAEWGALAPGFGPPATPGAPYMAPGGGVQPSELDLTPGIVGLFASSPRNFLGATRFDFMHYHRSLGSEKSAPQDMFPIHVVGHRVGIRAQVWRLSRDEVLLLPGRWAADANFASRLGVALTNEGVQNLRRCIWDYDNKHDIVVAFLQCGHSTRGVPGIMLIPGAAPGKYSRPGFAPGTYHRHHFPSMIFALHNDASLERLPTETVYVEAEVAQRVPWRQRFSLLPDSAMEYQGRYEPRLRIDGLDEHGYSEFRGQEGPTSKIIGRDVPRHTILRFISQAQLPDIAIVWDKSSVLPYPRSSATSEAEQSSQWASTEVSVAEGGTITCMLLDPRRRRALPVGVPHPNSVLNQATIVTAKGGVQRMVLNSGLHVVMRSRLEWLPPKLIKADDDEGDDDDNKKRAVVTIRIEDAV